MRVAGQPKNQPESQQLCIWSRNLKLGMPSQCSIFRIFISMSEPHAANISSACALLKHRKPCPSLPPPRPLQARPRGQERRQDGQDALRQLRLPRGASSVFAPQRERSFASRHPQTKLLLLCMSRRQELRSTDRDLVNLLPNIHHR